MKLPTRLLSIALTLWALTCAALAAQQADTTKGKPPTLLCKKCMDICDEGTLNFRDVHLPPNHWDMPEAIRSLVRATVMDVAAKFQRVYKEYNAGDFGLVYKLHEKEIGSFADGTFDSLGENFYTLKQLQTALFRDMAAAMQAAVKDSPSPEFAKAYKDWQDQLEGLIKSKSSDSMEVFLGRLGVCAALGEYKAR